MNRLGMWSAGALFAIGLLYLSITIYGISFTGFSDPIAGPVLTIMEVLTLLTAPLVVILLAVICSVASPERKVYSTVALGFGLIAAGMTSAVHFVSLTALKQTGSQLLYWPSPLFAVELLAWDIFLGFALLFSSFSFSGDGLRKTIRSWLIVTGSLCITGVLGPATGDMSLQFIALAGYGLILPAVWLMIAIDFHNASRQQRESALSE